jgi:NADPH:quinone reductase-like Zn-dependent oxidoreductase
VKAIVYERYGAPDVLELRQVPKPAPKADEVLIAIVATTVSSADWRVRSMAMPKGFGAMARLVFGISKPRQPILGAELAGVVESIGSAVTRFKPGDEVFALTAGMGCHAEYRCLRETAAIAHKPRELSFEQAAALAFGGSTALEFFRRAKLQPGERVLVNGASGCVGSAAVQIAKHFGAHVTAVCSAANFELVKSIGADAVLDYARTDFTQTGETYDVILDAAGTAPYSRCKGALTERGRLLLVLATLPAMLGRRSPR